MNTALASLRSATTDIHKRLESVLPVARSGADLSVYVPYLCDMWGWLGVFEKELWRSPWPEAMEPHLRSGKLEWIYSDLKAFGMSGTQIEELPLSPFRPDLGTMESRFGLAYVVEGAQLGGQVLAKRLSAQVGSQQMRWLRGYGDATSRRWQTFVACAGIALSSPAQQQTASRAAREAFLSLAAWFEQRESQRLACAVPQPSMQE